MRNILAILQESIPALTIHEVPSGTRVFDWTVPDEWNIRGGSLIGPEGETIIDFTNQNLHIVGYSEPVDVILPLEEMQEHLYSRPDMPDAVPYVTS
ncbi:hypothetical protein AGMMS49925_05520 [Deltaproteobacteria bacterium]|nr:hypothetical protein AGMMS49925_05520 [Deltaproteobacteria bacterium]